MTKRFLDERGRQKTRSEFKNRFCCLGCKSRNEIIMTLVFKYTDVNPKMIINDVQSNFLVFSSM